MTDSKRQQSTVFEELTGTASQVYRQVKRLVKEGTARRVIVRDNEEDRVMLDIPLIAGIAGTVLASYTIPVISAIALYLFGMNDVSIIVERKKEGAEVEEKEEVETRTIDIDNGED